jgi:hypothetical protein
VELVREVTPLAGAAAAVATAPAEDPRPTTELAPQPQVCVARVVRLVRIGWQIKVQLVLADGQPLVVQMTKEQVEAMRIVEGDRVFVNLKEAKVFVQDYTI